MIGKVIYQILSNDSSLTGLISTRILPPAAEQKTLVPYVTYKEVSSTKEKNKDRVTKIQTFRIQVDIYSRTYDSCNQIADAVCDALSYQSGTFAGYDVDIITFEDEQDLNNDQSEVFRKVQDYFIRVKL